MEMIYQIPILKNVMKNISKPKFTIKDCLEYSRFYKKQNPTPSISVEVYMSILWGVWP